MLTELTVVHSMVNVAQKQACRLTEWSIFVHSVNAEKSQNKFFFRKPFLVAHMVKSLPTMQEMLV